VGGMKRMEWIAAQSEAMRAYAKRERILREL